MNDPLLDLVARLPPAAMAPERARRSEGRCHRILARRAARHRDVTAGGSRTWARVTVVAAVAYLVEAARQAVGLLGLLRH